MSRWSVLQLKHGVFHQLLHGVQRVKKLPVAVQIAILQVGVGSYGLSIHPLSGITAGVLLAILQKIRTHR